MPLKMRMGSRFGSGPMGVVRKFFTSLFFLPFFLMGLFFIVMMIKGWSSQRAMEKWGETSCTILESDVREVSEGYEPYVKFEYEAGGQEWVSERFSNLTQSIKYSEAEGMIKPYPAGARATCRVDPQNPNEALLLVQMQWWLLLAIPFTMIFVLIGAGGIYAVWRKGDGAEGIASSTAPAADKAIGNVSTTDKKIGVIFGAFFFLIGMAMFYFLTFVPMLSLLRAQGWEEVVCIIDSSRLQSHRGDDGTTYSIDIRYRYNINNQEYTGDRYNFMIGSSSGSAGKQKVIRKYKKGTKNVCYVNPNNFAESVLDRSWSSAYAWCLFPIPFVGAGLAIMIGVSRSGKQRKFTGKAAKTAIAQAGVSGDWRGQQENQEATTGGRVVLKPASGRVGTLMGVILFSLFWNGIVSVFLTQLIEGFMSGNGEWFLAFFLIPFVLVGLGSIVAVLYFFLKLFNPKPAVTLNKAAFAPGETMGVEWLFQGNVYAIKKITIRLEGREEATYQRGTNTYTDKRAFFRKTMIESDGRADIMGGTKKITIPKGAMHSFDGGNNKIIWELNLHGDIRYWPDVGQKYQIEILPKGLVR